MTDEELLTLAAKAAGYTLWWKEGICKGGPYRAPFIGDKPWRPLKDDGDAFRLLTACEFAYCVDGALCCLSHSRLDTLVAFEIADMPEPTIRRMVVEAAAQLGRVLDDTNQPT